MGFQQGLSGLNSSSKSLDTIGNNIANSGTVGFKNGSTQFADVFAASLSGAGSAPVGIGAKVAGIVQQFSQGNISVTNNPLDTAINGGGFFQMDDGSGGTVYSRNGQFQLDKDGFIVSAQGLQLKGIAAVNGVIATGSPATPLRLFDPTQSLSGTPQATGASSAASGIQANVNLDSRLAVPATVPFDYGDPTSYNQSTATTIYDSLGNSHTYSMYFVKVAPATGVVAAENATAGTVQAATDLSLATEIAAGDVGAQEASNAVAPQATALVATVLAAATPADAATAISGFEAAARAQAITDAQAAGATLASATSYADKAVAAALSAGASLSANNWNVYATVTNPAGASPTFTDLSQGGTVTLDGATVSYSAAPLGNLTFDPSGAITSATLVALVTDAQLGYPGAINTPLGSALGTGFNVDFGGSTQYGAPFAVNAMLQDGFASGTLAGFNIGKDGIVLGRYTNGQTKPVGQVVLASFRNPQGLQPLGDNRWAQSPTSGDPITATPGSSGQFGVLQSSGLEDSNVDLTAELVNMITQQRAYQANAQTIKTQDSILQTLVNLR